MGRDWELIFTFLVGPEKQEFSIHEKALTDISSYFATLCEGDMMEAREGVIVWNDVEVETFTLFLEYVYSGNFAVKDKETSPDEQTKTGKKNRIDQYIEQTMLQYNQTEGGEKNGVTNWIKNGVDHNIDQAKLNYDETWQNDGYYGYSLDEYHNGMLFDSDQGAIYNALKPLHPNQHAIKRLMDIKKLIYADCKMTNWSYPISVDMAEMITCVKLYILADRYTVSGLGSLARMKIYEMLCQSKPLRSEELDEFTKVVEFAFEHTNSSETEPLRMLLTTYSACCYELYLEHPSFKHLLFNLGGYSAMILTNLGRWHSGDQNVDKDARREENSYDIQKEDVNGDGQYDGWGPEEN